MSLYGLYYGKVLKVYVYGEDSLPAVARCKTVETGEGHELAEDPASSDIALAPLLERRLSREEYDAPRLGTLIFHPSLLPVYRGRDAIRQAYKAGDHYTGVTWFWCEEGYDQGDIY